MDEADKASMRIYEHLQVSSITWMLHTQNSWFEEKMRERT